MKPGPGDAVRLGDDAGRLVRAASPATRRRRKLDADRFLSATALGRNDDLIWA
jgi:hypothetical protein